MCPFLNWIVMQIRNKFYSNVLVFLPLFLCPTRTHTEYTIGENPFHVNILASLSTFKIRTATACSFYVQTWKTSINHFSHSKFELSCFQFDVSLCHSLPQIPRTVICSKFIVFCLFIMVGPFERKKKVTFVTKNIDSVSKSTSWKCEFNNYFGGRYSIQWKSY